MKLTIADNSTLILSVGEATSLSLSAGEVTNLGTEKYTGEYIWTPSAETQTIQINGLQATADITIRPIPNNYGLVTYDGSTIKVS